MTRRNGRARIPRGVVTAALVLLAFVVGLVAERMRVREPARTQPPSSAAEPAAPRGEALLDTFPAPAPRATQTAPTKPSLTEAFDGDWIELEEAREQPRPPEREPPGPAPVEQPATTVSVTHAHVVAGDAQLGMAMPAAVPPPPPPPPAPPRLTQVQRPVQKTRGAGALAVRVLDENDTPLPGATVTLGNEQGKVHTTALLTSSDGIAEFPVLLPGEGYWVQVGFPGHSSRRLDDLRVERGKLVKLTVAMIEEITERVKVVAEREVVSLKTTRAETKLRANFTSDLPIPGRFYENVLTMTPGANEADRDSNPNVHGSRDRDFNMSVSGVRNVDPLTGQFMSRVNPNAVEDMEAITAGAGVEYGRAQGGFGHIIQKRGNDEPDEPVPAEVATGQARAFLEARAAVDGLTFQDARGYWANTYLPGDPLMRVLQARLAAGTRPVLRASSPPPALHDAAHPSFQPFDPPEDAALAVYLHADRRGLERPGRLLVQVGLAATPAHGGRRPAMNVGLVLDLRGEIPVEVAAGMRALVAAFQRASEPGDRFRLLVAGVPGGLAVAPERFKHGFLSVTLDRLLGADEPLEGPTLGIVETVKAAVEAVVEADDPEAPLGASAVILVASSPFGADAAALEALARESATAGIPLSVVGVGRRIEPTAVGRLALAGQGSLRSLASPADAEELVGRELSAASRVIARAVRLRVRLAPGVRLVEVVGSAPLDATRVQQVREQERSVDLRLARNLGLVPDRGEDEDGLQIVIPSFYAGDAHAVLLDVVAAGPGPIADVQVRYKDLVRLRNATARASLGLARVDEPPGALERNVLKSLLALRLADTLERAGQAVSVADPARATALLGRFHELLIGLGCELPDLAGDPDLTGDVAMLADYSRLLAEAAAADRRAWLADSLRYAGRLKLLPPPWPSKPAMEEVPMIQHPVDHRVLLLSLALCGSTVAAQDRNVQVQLPLETYQQMLSGKAQTHAPAGYALAQARVNVEVAEGSSGVAGTVETRLAVEVLEDGWVLVPVLAAGTLVEAATVAGKPAPLVSTAEGLAWSAKKVGAETLILRYRVEAIRSPAGFTLAIPVPRAASIELTAKLPGAGLDAAVIPASAVRTTLGDSTTQIEATVPSTSGIQLSWRTASKRPQTVSSATYRGQLVRDAMAFSAVLDVDQFTDATALLPLLSCSVTLTQVQVDGQRAPVLVEGERFATLLKGRGHHRVEVGFETPLLVDQGPPRIELELPAVPISRFDLTLPGRKELAVTPAAAVTRRELDGATIATVHLPLAERVSFSWSEAIPQPLEAELRASAAIYHVFHVEEGVLFARAVVDYAVNRGETHVVGLELPGGVQVDRITSESGAVVDWRLEDGAADEPRRLDVFLDRDLHGDLVFDVHYDRSLAPDGSSEGLGLALPLVRAAGVERQRGMAALLAGNELTLAPLDEGGAVPVGENQLPPSVHESLGMTVARTYKYGDALPRLVVRAVPVERVRGRFDAQVDTLVSLGDVTVTGNASVGINVKSGRILDLELELPEGINLLNLSAPSLRSQKIQPGRTPQLVDLEFTQEMEGQLRIELTYERILGDGEREVDVPTPRVRGAEVEQGRIAVEALSAVELRAASAEELSPLDVRELPRQLVLKTTNPILLAYKYVQAEPPHRLALALTRHRVAGVQEAAIDRAEHRTLVTADGLQLTLSRFMVRNSRKQFLRVQLPERSEVWSVLVDGRAEKPAFAGDQPAGPNPTVLIKIISQTRGFPVELLYATSGHAMERSGKLEVRLPRPDVLVGHTRWDLWLPDGVRYGELATNLSVSGATLEPEPEAAADAAEPAGPLQIRVPAAGIHYAFDKLYANQSDQEAWFRIPYRR